MGWGAVGWGSGGLEVKPVERCRKTSNDRKWGEMGEVCGYHRASGSMSGSTTQWACVGAAYERARIGAAADAHGSRRKARGSKAPGSVRPSSSRFLLPRRSVSGNATPKVIPSLAEQQAIT